MGDQLAGTTADEPTGVPYAPPRLRRLDMDSAQGGKNFAGAEYTDGGFVFGPS